MKVIVAGSRNITSRRVVSEAIAKSGFAVTELVSASKLDGPDRVAHRWARDQQIPYFDIHQRPQVYGRMARRQQQFEMAQYADALVAVWDGKSPGTKHMIETARRMGLKVYVEIVQ